MVRVGNDGAYTAEHLAPGEYTVFAFQPGYLNRMEDLMNEPESRLSPQKQREALARGGSVALRGSETATLNITLERGATLGGRILYSDGAPAAEITLILEDTTAKPSGEKALQQQAVEAVMMRGMLTHQSMSTDDEGRFRLSGIKAGKYRLAATQPAQGLSEDDSEADGMNFLAGMLPDTRALRFYAGDTPHRSAAKVFDLQPGDRVDGIEITVPVDAFHTVRGAVTATDGRVVNMGHVTLTDSTDKTLVFHTGLDVEGRFKLFQVPTGTYILRVTDAHIGRPASIPNNQFLNAGQLQPTNAFADGGLSVLVGDNDVSDISLSLSEETLPSSEHPSRPSAPDSAVIPQL